MKEVENVQKRAEEEEGRIGTRTEEGRGWKKEDKGEEK